MHAYFIQQNLATQMCKCLNSSFIYVAQWRDEFEESVEMSTYLVAFVICDYDSITNKTLKQIDVAIHTPPGLLSQAQFALETAVQLMDYYDEFFGVPYPLPKQGEHTFSRNK
jgi:hypothetical protein